MRFAAWLMLSAAAAAMVLAAVSLLGISYFAPRGGGAGLQGGSLHIEYAAKGAQVDNTPSGWMFRGPAGRRTGVSGGNGWMSDRYREGWFYQAQFLYGGPMPPGGRGRVLMAMVHIPLPRSAAVLGAVGGVLFWVSRRKRTPNSCPSCDYALSGLAPGTACPECGSQPIAQHQGNGPGSASRTESSPGLSIPPLMPRNPGSL